MCFIEILWTLSKGVLHTSCMTVDTGTYSKEILGINLSLQFYSLNLKDTHSVLGNLIFRNSDHEDSFLELKKINMNSMKK